MKYTAVKYLILCIFNIVLGVSEDEYAEETAEEGNALSSDNDIRNQVPLSKCWMTLNTPQLFQVLDEIDDRYAKIRYEVQESLRANDFDQTMIKGFMSSRGAALRELHEHHHDARMIPSGINLGGYCMLRMSDSILFFHRMKLRNNTYFRIDYLENELANMVVRIHLSLNDLHLKGAYERSLTDRDPSILIYAPTFGQVELLLKDVKYRMEGRYRLIKNRLLIELVSSEITANDILMTYINQATENEAVRVEKDNLGGFIQRMKADLDKWLKDYFNDYMIYAGLEGIKHIDDLAKYDKEKETALEEYTDNAISAMVTRIRLLNADTIKLPTFTFKSIQGLQIKLYDGVLQGLDTMHRRSVATGLKHRDIRKVDTVVGFSNLKVIYKYEAMILTGVPPLAGVLALSANELSAHLALALVLDPETIDLDIEFFDQMKPESLTVEGSANIMIANFRHVLEHQIVSVMSNTLIHGIRMLRSLPSCEPFVPGQVVEKDRNMPQIYLSTEQSEYMSEVDHNIEYQPEESKNNYVNSDSHYKAALRSTKKPQTTPRMKQSNKKLVMKKKLRNINRKTKKTHEK